MCGSGFKKEKNRIRKILVCALLICVCIIGVSCTRQIPKELTPKMTLAMWMMYAMTNQWEKSEFYCTPHFLTTDQVIFQITARHGDPIYMDVKELPKNKAGIAEYLYLMEEDQSYKCTVEGDKATVIPPDFSGLSIVLVRSGNRWLLDHINGWPENYNVEDFRKLEKMGAFD